MTWTRLEETKLVEYLSGQVCERASGHSESECLRNYPRDMYFTGNLRPQPQAEGDQPGHFEELVNKLSPVAFGAEFRLEPDGDEITIGVTVRWNCYYRIFPTLAQQQELLAKQDSAENEDSDETSPTDQQRSTSTNMSASDSEDRTLEVEREQEERIAELESPEVAESPTDRRRRRIPQDTLFVRFRKLECTATGQLVFRRDANHVWGRDTSNLQVALNSETTRSQHIAMNDPERVRTAGSPDDKIRVPENVLASEADYMTYLQSLQTDVVPEWRWEVSANVRHDNDDPAKVVFSVEFINRSPQQDNPNIEEYLFNTQAEFAFPDVSVHPFELELAPRGFRYDRELWGRGFNCAIDREPSQPATFITTHTPIYRQMRYVTQTHPPARFEDLANNPLPTLRAILKAMEAYRQVWDTERRRYETTYPDWEAEFGGEFDRDRQQFEDEIRRFRRGCELVRTNQDIRLAFQLTNETFCRLGNHPKPEKRKDSWRLFQLVFLVSQIPGIEAIANSNSPDASEREIVDIIYFPTGGGKTEAYLGTIVFHCFFDRLHGKAAGVTNWTRFPLRLLTLQQTQRVADVIGIAELVRREQADPRLIGRDVDGFAVGYFVGAEATPNELVHPSYPYSKPKDTANWSLANDPDARQRWKRVISCPACRTTTVHVDFDPTTVRIVHRCSQSNCIFSNGEIPVYVIDNEIYRYLPCVIVGTIDKLAGLGNQRKLSQVFGQIDGRCIKHGYYKGKCCQKGCSDQKQLRAGRPRGLSGPTLFVQDELHLLKEGLGTFDGHYETFTQQLQREFGQTTTLKVIASSATIEKFERQVEHLYGRRQDQARVFPRLGPSLGESFYAKTLDYPQRLFIGIIPHNKTIFNTILELIEFYHRAVQHLQKLQPDQPNPYGGDLTPASTEWYELLDLYTTSLTYFLANRELDSIRTDLEGDVNPNLLRDGLQSLNIHQLTGGTSTDDVTCVLERLEAPATPNSMPDAVLATNMVSHGVDVDRFNAMIFYGMPRQNAEYIQASSRVGRSHVGIVFNCLHPTRERDRSHYTYFKKFHEFLGQLVEPVAINRWAKFSINRTLPGLFMAVLLQLIATRPGAGNPGNYYKLDFVKQKITTGEIGADDFVPLLEQAYIVSRGNTIVAQTLREEIRLRVEQFLFDQIVGAGSGENMVSNVIIPRPMISLRDVDEPVSIELDSTGTQWAARVSNRE